ncbi:ABC transporter ATP-binding protein [Rugosimonospora africana]|uniref:Dipeptide/oligopeptide/nickel ABC transporter ATP-binding protein n=1 Tax=Rugosimonospora africana TaxID=556532 RepID=A0A8J3VRM0_9ACTN|nr:ABC transporter ATP-binding protein [Rugosimonospora africana]GIH16287.1 dipeptide/oligopeptide/nickel ABC transporter ATP-binding protein [Rugosimonospora africana]
MSSGGGGAAPVLSVRDIAVDYAGPRTVHAVRGVSFDLGRSEVLGIAGESGCGKSTLAYAIARLLRPPARMTAGSVVFHDTDGTAIDVTALSGEALRTFRWRRVAMVFQGAMNALNPVLSVRAQLGDVLRAHLPDLTRREREDRCRELLDLVGIEARWMSGYPHELSGGMRQRVMIAMAMALRPDVVILDEPTTALDVVVQREILEEIDRLRSVFGFAVIFITHDLSLLLEISDRLIIMYGGLIVEQGRATEIQAGAHHPYTLGMLGSIPTLRGDRRVLHGIPGTPPDLADPPSGCPFTPRCRYAFGACGAAVPPLLDVGTLTACAQYDPALRPDGPDDALGSASASVPAGSAADSPVEPAS